MSSPRPLTAEERGVLDALLGQSFAGVEALRAQAVGVLAVWGCTCGCGTIDLVGPATRTPVSFPEGVATEANLNSDAGEPIGGVILPVHGVLDRLILDSR